MAKEHSSWLVTLILLLITPSATFPDTLTGEIRGSVIDLEGRVPLPGTTLALTSADRGWSKMLQTDARGTYTFLQLEPGAYTVAAEKEGFYPSKRTDVLIRLNTPKVLIPPFELRKKVMTATEQVTLRGEQTKTAIVDMSTPGAIPAILALLSAPGFPSLVSLADAALRFNFESLLVQSLPLTGGRSFDQLALFTPGASRAPQSANQGPAVGIGVGSAGQFSVNGSRPRSNNFTVDGSDNNDEDIGVRRQGFVALVPQSAESVQEFQLVSAGAPAESGRNSGSMVNAVSRSGAKEPHGTLYGFFNDDALNSNGFFDRPMQDRINTGALSGGTYEKRSREAIYGATLGGPLRNQGAFYFLSFEQQRSDGSALGHFIVPAAGERGLRTSEGLVPISELEDFFAERGIGYSSAAGAGVFSLYPLPNNPSGPFGDNEYAQVRDWLRNATNFSAKADFRVGAVHGFTARYNFTDDHAGLPFTGDAISSSVSARTRTQNISLFLNSTGANTASALRFSFGRTALTFPPQGGGPLLFGSAPSDVLPPELNQTIETSYGSFGPFGSTGPIGQLWIAPYSPVGVDVYNFPQGRADNTYQVSEFVTRTGTAHTLKFGIDFRRSQLNSFSDRNSRPLLLFGNGIVSSSCTIDPVCLFNTPDGLLRGTDLAALGAPAAFLQSISTEPIADTTIGLRFSQYDFFVQDTWKIGSNLTLNVGLRYELQTVPHEVNRRIERTFGLSPNDFGHLVPGGGAEDAQVIRAGNQGFDAALNALNGFLDGRNRIYDADTDNFGPRIGLAWDPSGSGKTALRAGFSLMHDATIGAVTSQSRNVFPTFAPLNVDPSFYTPSGLVVNNPRFFTFTPTDTLLIRPGSLNSFNLTGDAMATALGTLFVQAPPFPGGSLSSNGLAFTLPEKALKTATAQQYLLSIEKQFSDYYLVSAAYVGTRGLHLTRFVTPNAGLVSTPVLLSPSPDGSAFSVVSLPPAIPATASHRPETSLGAYTVFQNSATSDYHSLQLRADSRMRRGLQFRGGWTWSHAIDQVSDPFDSRAFFALPQDNTQLRLERASANFDSRHRLTFLCTWAVPGSSQLLRGWNLAGMGEFQSGQPYTVNSSMDRNRDGNLTDRPDSAAGLVAPRGTIGRVGRNTVRADRIDTVDLAVSRSLRLSERAALALRVEVFNCLNHAQFGVPIRILESPGFGHSFDTQVKPRTIRLAVKFSF